nr:reverse transcriptase domain-containing protein [Tanacetum cinerariifolium]
MYIKDPVEIHHIKQKEGESTEAFMERFKEESMHVNGAPECMRITGFMHGITYLDLIKKLNDNIPKSVDEMMNLSHPVKEIKQRGKRGEHAKAAKKGEAPNKEKATTIFMVQPRQRITRQKTTQSFSTGREISFSPLKDSGGEENPIMIKAEVEGHLIHRMRRREFNKRPYELYGGQIIVTIQQYHRPPKSLKNPSSSVHNPRNAKIPNGRRNSENPQQHHNTSGVQNGSESTKHPSTQRANGHRRNQSSNPPRVSGTNYHDRRKL